ncbi:MAG TPA: ABC transporter ATP-binding protein [Exilispira sp.]|nr:ABC transporter ATP-binding protein [Exilispira sp.]
MLKCKNILIKFGGLIAVNQMNLEVKRGTIHSLIGPNGAGKTTLFNAISRLIEVDDGQIEFDGISILEKKPYNLIRYGIARTFQNLQLLPYQTVQENILAAIIYQWKGTIFDSMLGFHNKFMKDAEEKAYQAAKLFGIQNRLGSVVGSLPYGIQKKVELARTLVADPKILLLDEPAAGLNNEETAELDEILLSIKNKGITILLVEHDMNLVMRISDLVTVMNFGRFVASGKPEEISQNPEVIKAYLGSSYGT